MDNVFVYITGGIVLIIAGFALYAKLKACNWKGKCKSCDCGLSEKK